MLIKLGIESLVAESAILEGSVLNRHLVARTVKPIISIIGRRGSVLRELEKKGRVRVEGMTGGGRWDQVLKILISRSWKVLRAALLEEQNSNRAVNGYLKSQTQSLDLILHVVFRPVTAHPDTQYFDTWRSASL